MENLSAEEKAELLALIDEEKEKADRNEVPIQKQEEEGEENQHNENENPELQEEDEEEEELVQQKKLIEKPYDSLESPEKKDLNYMYTILISFSAQMRELEQKNESLRKDLIFYKKSQEDYKRKNLVLTRSLQSMRGFTASLVKDADTHKRKDIREKRVLQDLQITDAIAESMPPPD